MKKSLLLVVLVLVLLAMTAAPGVAAGNGAERTDYYGCEVFGAPLSTADTTMQFKGNTVHVRGLLAEATEYVWDGSAWSEAGTNSTVWNINAKGTVDDPFFGWSDIFLWGTFHLDLNLNGFDIGEYTGRWNLLIDDNPNQGPDTARGNEVDGKRLQKGDLNPDLADFPAGSLEALPAGCGPFTFTIIDPGK